MINKTFKFLAFIIAGAYLLTMNYLFGLFQQYDITPSTWFIYTGLVGSITTLIFILKYYLFPEMVGLLGLFHIKKRIRGK